MIPIDDDRALAAASRRGDLAAFDRLVERHRDVVLRVASRVVGADDAEDVAQDTFLRAFHRLDGYRGDGPFRAWLLRIAHRTALRAAGERRPAAVPLSALEREPGGLPAERTPAERLESRERLARLDAKLKGLPPAHRAVLVLRDVEGFSYEEIAQVTEAPLNSVKGRLHRARAEFIDTLRRNTYDWDLPR